MAMREDRQSSWELIYSEAHKLYGQPSRDFILFYFNAHSFFTSVHLKHSGLKVLLKYY